MIKRYIKSIVFSTVGTTGDTIDLTSQSRTVSFVSGQTFGDASFTFMDDSFPENDETFGVELVPRNDLNFGVPSRVVLTIIDDDSEKYCIISTLLF